MADAPTPPADEPAPSASVPAPPPPRRRIKPISNRVFGWGQVSIGFSMFAWMLLVVFAIAHPPKEYASALTLIALALFALAFVFWILSCLIAVFERPIEVEPDPITGKSPGDTR